MKLWTILEVLKWTTNFFLERGIDNPRLEAEHLLSEVLAIPRLELYLRFEQPLDPSERDSLKQLVVRRANHEPLQYIVGYTEFYGYRIEVDRRVLIPRHETELLVEAAIGLCRFDTKVLDIGTGSGAIPIAIVRQFPGITVHAVDISKDALELAAKNALMNTADVQFYHSDIYENVPDVKYGLIISNPPYIRDDEYEELAPEITRYEPKLALTAGVDGLDAYRRILESAGSYLEEGGKILLEIGAKQATAIIKLAESNGFNTIEIRKDYNDRDRIAVIGR